MLARPAGKRSPAPAAGALTLRGEAAGGNPPSRRAESTGLKKALLVGLGIAAVLAAIHFLRRALELEENKVRRQIASMADSFNRSRAGGVLAGIAEDFVEESARVGKREIHSFLAYLILKERDPGSKEFRYRVEVSEPEIVLVPPEKAEGTPGAGSVGTTGARSAGLPRAEVTLEANFLELRAGSFVSVWKATIRGDFAKGPEGWQVVRARHETVEGRRPWR